jgi:hypothetical protein
MGNLVMGAPSDGNFKDAKDRVPQGPSVPVSGGSDVPGLYEATLRLAYGDIYSRVAHDMEATRQLLYNADPRLRQLALMLIGGNATLPDEVATKARCLCTDDPDAQVRRCAVYITGQRCIQKPSAALFGLLARIALDESEESGVRRAAYQGVVLADLDPKMCRNINILVGDFDVGDFDLGYLAKMSGGKRGRDQN